MNSRIRRISLFVMTLIISLIMCGAAVYAEATGNLVVGDQTVLDNDGAIIEGTLPEGAEFNVETQELVLTDCTLDLTGKDIDSYIWASGFNDLKIVLKGTNVFKGASNETFCGILNYGKLTIQGDGSLTMDLSGCSTSASGIQARDNILIMGDESNDKCVSLDIVGGETAKSGYFKGLELESDYGYYTEDEEDHGITIQKAKVGISGKLASDEFTNYGIVSNDGDVNIEDSTVNIDIAGGSTTGICSGAEIEKDGSWRVFGGSFNVKDNYTDDSIDTLVSVKLHVPVGEGSVAVDFYEDDMGLQYKYMADPEDETAVEWTLSDETAPWYTTDYENNGRISSYHKFIVLSAASLDDPGADPRTDPGTDPGTDPVTDPGDDPGTEPEKVDVSKSVKIGGKDIVVKDDTKESGYAADTDVTGVTGGMSYDVNTRTLTLENCVVEAKEGDMAYVESDGPLNIVLKGTNTFQGATGYSASSKNPFFGIHAAGKLKIEGTGSLTMEFGNIDGYVVGIQGDNIIDINDSTIKMNGATGNYMNSEKLPVRHGDFYGIRMDPGLNNYCEANGNVDYEEMDFHVGIYNADIRISNACASVNLSDNLAYYDNIGVKTWDSNLIVIDSKIDLTMRGSVPKGLSTGYYDSRRYGGKLSIDEKSHVKIRLIGPGTTFSKVVALQFFQEYDPETYEYVSVHDFIKSPYIYVGDQLDGSNSKEPITWVLWNESMDGTQFAGYWSTYLIDHGDSYDHDRVCMHQALELSPVPVDHSEPESTDTYDDETPSDDPTPSQDEQKYKVGDKVKTKIGTVKITSTKKKTATITKAKDVKKYVIPDTSFFSEEFMITGLAKNAFKNNKKTSDVTLGNNIVFLSSGTFTKSKVTTLRIKSKKLTKKSIKGCLKGSKIKRVIVKVGSKKLNKKYAKKYKKYFTKKNVGRKVVVKY